MHHGAHQTTRGVRHQWSMCFQAIDTPAAAYDLNKCEQLKQCLTKYVSETFGMPPDELCTTASGGAGKSVYGFFLFALHIEGNKRLAQLLRDYSSWCAPPPLQQQKVALQPIGQNQPL